MSNEISSQTQEYFQKNKYVVIRNFLDPNIVGLIYRYCITQVMAMDYKFTYDRDSYDKRWDGEWKDVQAPGSYSKYGDVLMDTVMTSCLPLIQNYTGLSLVPNYTYWRHYQKDVELVPHRDRFSCEISATICLGYDTSNLDSKEYPDYSWPIFMEDLSGANPNGIEVQMKPGDIIIYKGCELTHWRDKCISLAHAQLFMHYNTRVSDNQVMFDGRPIIGIPKDCLI